MRKKVKVTKKLAAAGLAANTCMSGNGLWHRGKTNERCV